MANETNVKLFIGLLISLATGPAGSPDKDALVLKYKNKFAVMVKHGIFTCLHRSTGEEFARAIYGPLKYASTLSWPRFTTRFVDLTMSMVADSVAKAFPLVAIVLWLLALAFGKGKKDYKAWATLGLSVIGLVFCLAYYWR